MKPEEVLMMGIASDLERAECFARWWHSHAGDAGRTFMHVWVVALFKEVLRLREALAALKANGAPAPFAPPPNVERERAVWYLRACAFKFQESDLTRFESIMGLAKDIADGRHLDLANWPKP